MIEPTIHLSTLVMLLLLLSPVRTTSPPLSVHSGAEHETIMTVFVFSKKKGGGCCIAQSFSCCSRHSHQPKLVRAHLSSQRCAILQPPPFFVCMCGSSGTLPTKKFILSSLRLCLFLQGHQCSIWLLLKHQEVLPSPLPLPTNLNHTSTASLFLSVQIFPFFCLFHSLSCFLLFFGGLVFELNLPYLAIQLLRVYVYVNKFRCPRDARFRRN